MPVIPPNALKMAVLTHFPMEKTTGPIFRSPSQTPPVYIPLGFQPVCILQNSITSILLDNYEADKTHRHPSKPPLRMNIQIWKEGAQLSKL